MSLKKLLPIVLALAIGALVGSCASGQTPVYRDPGAPLSARVDSLFNALTPGERLSLLSGNGYGVNAIPRLNIPSMEMVDAGQGVRGGDAGTQGRATLFPSGVVMARTWDRKLVYEAGRAIGQEAHTKGTGAQVLLAPDVNIHRSPLGGRDGESFSEDPYDNAQLAVAYIDGVQSSGTAACVKHFICNNEEGDRGTVDVEVDQRALHEIYMPAFKAAVQQGHVWTLMAAYNRILGHYVTANHFLLDDTLKQTWGFQGLAMSDWGAVHRTAGAVNAGLDLEMPGGAFLTPDKLTAALQASRITQAEIDDSVKRVLSTMILTGMLNPPSPTTPAEEVNSPEHRALTLKVASEGIVLLKNAGGILPLNSHTLRSIAVIGDPAQHIQAGAEGSPGVTPFSQSEPLDAIEARAGSGVKIAFVNGVTLPGGGPSPVPTADLDAGSGAQTGAGFYGQYYASPDLSGAPVVARIDSGIRLGRGNDQGLPTGAALHSARWTAVLTAPVTGKYTLAFFTDAGCRVLIGEHPVIDSPNPGGDWRHVGDVNLTAGAKYHVEVDLLNATRLRGMFGWMLPEQDDAAAAASAASKADVALVFVTTHGTDGEGRDRPSMDLPGNQNQLIEAVAAANKHTIVIVNSGTPVLMTPWIDKVEGVLDVGFPGEQGGIAIARVLFGDTNPSGKLTDTIAKRLQDYPSYGNFPGTNGIVHYAEGIYVGYRHFDKAHIAPLFPFGFGLSYTTFAYSHLTLSSPRLAPSSAITAAVTVTNTGKRPGADVVELYMQQPHPSVNRPVRELKGFERVELAPGQSKRVKFSLTPQAFAYWDTSASRWRADPGPYDIEIAASSRDIRLTKAVTLTGQYSAKD